MNTTKADRRSLGWVNEFGPVCCGRIVAMDASHRPLVDFPGNSGPAVLARCLDTVQFAGGAPLGDLSVLLVFDQGDPTKPIIIGTVTSSASAPGETHADSTRPEPSRHAVVDGRHVMLKGDEEVTLVCGKAAITLTKDGRISLRGVEIVSRASRANKIRGASVNIN